MFSIIARVQRLVTSPALAGAGEVLQLVCLFVCHTMYIMYWIYTRPITRMYFVQAALLVGNPGWQLVVNFREFLLLARYVPNVAKRSIWDQCKKKYILRTDRRPTDLSFGQYWGNFKWPYLRKGSSDPLHVWFYGGVFGVGGSNSAISGFAKFNRYDGKTMRNVIRLVTI